MNTVYLKSLLPNLCTIYAQSMHNSIDALSNMDIKHD